MRINRTVIADLQERIDQIAGGAVRQRQTVPFGVPEIDSRLPGGGLALGATHEIAGGGTDVVCGAVSALFTAGIAARIPGPVIWCLTRTDLFAPSLVQVGLSMDRVIFVESKDEEGVIECAEEGLRYRGVAVVVAELVRLPMVASRRFQLAAEQSGATGLIIRRWRRQQEATDFGSPTASMTRWRVSPLPSEPLPVPGIGRPRWFLELMRVRAAESFDVEVNACNATGHMTSIEEQEDPWRVAL
ncbi:ImuA family protein [Neorhizobium sp. JUb45]|uniref:ImuA family protein n=1 Tax=Neorhizobium sp. JUb45 TaxID=2485113 RepID=UPI0010501D14|nr:ImuA family protein [Neorhizobium sp. JUb45]TCR07289.1 protein ImuA [Neorhizobium sp. JUb45]